MSVPKYNLGRHLGVKQLNQLEFQTYNEKLARNRLEKRTAPELRELGLDLQNTAQYRRMKADELETDAGILINLANEMDVEGGLILEAV
jgi:hypothetical protein